MSQQLSHEFEITLQLNTDDDKHREYSLEKLRECGCGDADIECEGRDIHLLFERVAASEDVAILKAMKEVLEAHISAKLTLEN